ncbi:MgtC/SapB family protein [Haloglomus salinum]|uniref:MgtC/SapB family protein n=1 Tax=Haloglomus salinum TaxID=2962673 RepID=UPI0020C9E885|nr:MgtC/SapB family protein [Haloglomus salinum]
MEPVLSQPVLRLAVAAALGMFIGFERERSEKAAGVRTFALLSLAAAVFVVVERPLLLAVGGLLVVVLGGLLGARAVVGEREGLALTTTISMLVAYGVGALAGAGELVTAVAVGVVTALLLVSKRELHGVADQLSREEVRAAAQFAIIGFVVYPLLPAGERSVALAGATVAVEPRVVWAMVVTVAGIGIVNYAAVRVYGGRGIAVTGFLGGLASSTAVVGSAVEHVREDAAATPYAVAAVLLGNAAMSLRNLAIALVFTLGATVPPLTDVALPLGALAVGSVGAAATVAGRGGALDVSLDRPFTLRYVLSFGLLFLLVVVAGSLADSLFGTAGFYATAALAGLVSSAGVTTSAVVLYRSGSMPAEEAVVGILVATAASLVVKVALTAPASDRRFTLRVAGWSGAAALAAAAVTVAALFT